MSTGNLDAASTLDGKIVVFYNCGSDKEDVLHLSWGDSAEGTAIIGRPYDTPHTSLPHQQWQLKQVYTGLGNIWPTFHIQNVKSGTVVDLTDGSDADGTPVTGRSAKDPNNPHQLWYILTANTDYKIVQIQNFGTKTVLELPTSPSAAKHGEDFQICGFAAAKLTARPEDISQLWKMEIVG